MSPSVGGALWREVESNALVVDGHVFPKGYDVGTSIYSVHHKEEYFPDSYLHARAMDGRQLVLGLGNCCECLDAVFTRNTGLPRSGSCYDGTIRHSCASHLALGLPSAHRQIVGKSSRRS